MTATDTLTIRTSDGRWLDALVSGPPDGRVLVLHTGTPCGLVPLPERLDPAPMGIRTVLFARPGYGGSTPRAGRTIADTAADTAALLDALGAASFLNLGWSGGGPHALACDALLADRCLATGIIAGVAPYEAAEAGSPVREWYEADEDNQLALAGNGDGFRRAVNAFVAQLANVTAEDITAEAASEADREFCSEGYADWVAAFLRAAGASGGRGPADDYLASFRDWGFPLSQVRRVVIWHGSDDRNVPPYHAQWLESHLPRVELHLLEHESHNSVMRHLPEVIRRLLAEAESAPS